MDFRVLIIFCFLAIAAEKTDDQLKESIKSFKKDEMKHTEVAEKVVLPSKEGL